MNTLSIPNHTSPEGNFSQGAASSHAAPQGEASPSVRSTADQFRHECDQLDRAWKIFVWIVGISVAFSVWLAICHPLVFAVATVLVLSASTIIGCYWFATHRGNAEIGVSDTQGRDSSTHNSAH